MALLDHCQLSEVDDIDIALRVALLLGVQTALFFVVGVLVHLELQTTIGNEVTLREESLKDARRSNIASTLFGFPASFQHHSWVDTAQSNPTEF